MNKNILKIIIIIVIIVAVIAGIMYFIDKDRMEKGEEVVFSTWGEKNAPIVEINQNEINTNYENTKKYSKTIENLKIELTIPNEWNYEEMQKNEENDFYKYALKLYKNNSEQYAVLYLYHDLFGVCGTARTEEDITLNNGKEATIGYYDGSKIWSDISFYNTNKSIAVINYNLTESESQEVIELIKTINIIEEI